MLHTSCHPKVSIANLDAKFKEFTIQHLGDIMEAILIETIEPRQNRKQGNSFSGLEYLQQEAR